MAKEKVVVGEKKPPTAQDLIAACQKACAGLGVQLSGAEIKAIAMGKGKGTIKAIEKRTGIKILDD